MQSKQKTRTKPRKQKKQKAASKASAQRAPRTRREPYFEKKVSASLIESTVRGALLGWKFGSAAPHDEFPEGGLRISGALPGGTACGQLTNDTAGYGLWSTGGYVAAMVSPTAVATAVSFPVFSSTGALAVFAQYFRRFRFRKLDAAYSSRVSTSLTDMRELSLTYDRDAYAAEGWGTGGSAVYNGVVNATTKRFPGWTPFIEVPLIREKGHTKSDELWYTTIAGDSVVSTDASTIRQVAQGAILSAVDNVQPSADKIFGSVEYRFVIDLYGFNAAVGNGIAFGKRSRDDVKIVRNDEPEYVSLTPRRGLRIDLADSKAPSVSSSAPATSRVASKK